MTVATSGMAVEARAVSRAYPGDGAGPVEAVRGVSLTLEPGGFAALAGRSGSGKTTLLALLGGLDDPTSGSVLLDGTDVAARSRAERTLLARSIGPVFQNALLVRRMPVWENVACGLVPLGVPAGERLALAEATLRRVGMERFLHRPPERLSAGERQRVALARALVQEPRLILADEPTSNLDPESAAIVAGVLAEAGDAGCTVLVASHDAVLLGRATRILRMEEGRIVDDA